MPTERFYRLPTEKQEAIRVAAFREFARVPFDKASINRIVKGAEISRGSFYTYFTDKQDALEYNCTYIFKFMTEESEDQLRKSGGNVWIMLQKVLLSLMDFFDTEERIQFCHNAFAYLSSRQALSGPELSGEDLRAGLEESSRKALDSIYEIYRESTEKPVNFEAFNLVLQLAYTAMMNSFKAYFEGVPREKVLRDYRFVLGILENGAGFGMQPE